MARRGRRASGEIVQIPLRRGESLDGCLLRAGGPGGRAAALFLHGRTLDLFNPIGRILPGPLADLGISSLLFDRRGHSIASAPEGYGLGGGARSLYAEHKQDVRAALRHLRRLGFRRILMVGHSMGGLLAADIGGRARGVAALVLLSPIPAYAGLPLGLEERDRGRALLARARRRVAGGRGEELFLLPKWPFLLSAAVALDAEGNPEAVPLRVSLGRLRKPLLVLFGDAGTDARLAPAAARAFEGCPSRDKRWVTLEGADHLYRGFEERVAAEVVAFLRWRSGSPWPARPEGQEGPRRPRRARNLLTPVGEKPENASPKSEMPSRHDDRTVAQANPSTPCPAMGGGAKQGLGGEDFPAAPAQRSAP